MGSLAEADTRETPEQVAAATAKIDPLSGRFLRAKQALDAMAPPEVGSRLARLDAQTSPFNTSELVVSNLYAAIDNLHVFLRYLRRARELPMLAHYGLIRSAVESTSYGLWVLAGRQQAAASRTLRMALDDQNSARRLFRCLGTAMWDTDEMQQLVRQRHHALRGIEQSDLDKEIQTTNTIAAVDRTFDHREGFTGLQVWRATSGFTHASPAAMVFLLERSPDGMRTSRMALSIAFFETAVENIELLVERSTALSKAGGWAAKPGAQVASGSRGRSA